MNRKRTETNGVIKPIGEYLQVLENSGQILWWDRLNSGSLTIPGKNKFYRVRLCRQGTPDMYYIMPNGWVVWIECKSDKGAQEPEQLKFQGMLAGIENHFYLLVRCLDEFIKYHATLKGTR